jgi:hypothetical protein
MLDAFTRGILDQADASHSDAATISSAVAWSEAIKSALWQELFVVACEHASTLYDVGADIVRLHAGQSTPTIDSLPRSIADAIKSKFTAFNT